MLPPCRHLFLASGIRGGEAVTPGMNSLTGPPGARRLEVTGKGDKPRTIPIDPSLERVLAIYQATRTARFPDDDLDHPATPLLLDTGGRRLAAHQISYLIERLYARAGIRSRIPKGATADDGLVEPDVASGTVEG